MSAAEDPGTLLAALRAGGDDAQALRAFTEAQVEAARAAALAPSEASPAEVAALPAPLALAVLEAAVEVGAASLADALAAVGERALSKAAKKALYRLRSRGAQVPSKRPASPPPPAAGAPEAALPSLVSALTGTGERALIIGREVRGRVETLQCVLADEHGVVHLGVNEISRGQYRRVLKDARRPGAPPAVEIPLEVAKELLAEATFANLRTHTPFPEGLDAALRHLEVSPWTAPRALPQPEDADQARAVGGASLHDEPEIAQWLPPVEAIRTFGEKAKEIAASPLYIDDRQREAHLREALNKMAESFLSDEQRRVYGRRLWLMADFFERTARPEAAQIARAEARRIFHGAPGLLSPFTVRLFEKVMELSGGAGSVGEPRSA